MNIPATVDIRNLCVMHRKSGYLLVDSLSLSISHGSSLVILGQSGCGKTMTCRAIIGLLDRNKFHVSGSIAFEGTDLLAMKRQERRALYGKEIAMIPQNPMTAFDPSMRIGAQMQETLLIHGVVARNRAKQYIEEALRQAGLDDPRRVCHCYPYMMSGGMLQRVLIAMASMTSPRLVVADEPTTALDVVHADATVDSFKEIRKRGAAVLLVTHDFSVASRMGGDLLVMKDGKLVEQGRTETLLTHPEQLYTKALLAACRLSSAHITEEVC